jgi:hypothetical protein
VLERLFTDRRRRLKILIGIMLLGALGARYAWVAQNLEIGYRWCLEAPAERDGSTLVFALWQVTRIDDAQHYAISKVVKDIPVEGDAAGLKLGDTVSVVGSFRARDAMVVEGEREIHVLRKYKEALGVTGFVLAALGAPFLFRWRGGRLEARPLVRA